MISSYYENNYGELIGSLIRTQSPKQIIEFGLLNGYSSFFIIEAIKNTDCKFLMCDIFENFKYNSASYDNIQKIFGKIKNVSIANYNFFEFHNNKDIKDFDVVIIDIGNTEDTYKYFFENVYEKLSSNCLIILEGGSIERDEYYISKQYNTGRINTYLNNLDIKYITLQKFPSMTILIKN